AGAAAADQAPHRHLPLAGVSDGSAFLRSPDGTFVFFPNGRIQADAYLFRGPTEASTTKNTVLVKRARLELFGWIGPHFAYNIAGEFAASPPAGADPIAPSALATADNWILAAPLSGKWRDTLLIYLGQYDLPFGLENRTSDKWFDFIERSISSTFAVPPKKDLGLMVSGILPNQLVHYVLGVFNGEGSNFKNVDNRFDVLGRAWIAPLALTRPSPASRITIGGSFWIGDRKDGLPYAAQSTAGGFKFLDPRWTSPIDSRTPFELHQNGDLRAYAVEVDAPIGHRLGLRFEFLYKDQELSEYDITSTASGKMTWVGGARLKGWALYGEAWGWLLGDDRLVGRPNVQTPARLARFGVSRPRHGLQLLARVERLDENITADTPANGNPLLGHTRVTSLELGAVYWYTRRFRVLFNYDLNLFGSAAPGGGPTANTSAVWTKLGGKHWEHEFLLRAAIAL
ncbi:MAG: hypothetical protein HY906_24315, partial [Deltaproteobacteria bacterium]|nr:hypothetical protein [Deltaproteobacteria bacterium]